MMRILGLIGGLFLCSLLPATVLAASVSLNGVAIDGATKQRFENCTVVIDEFGNVNIIADGYKVSKPGVGQKASEPDNAKPIVVGAKPTKRYWIVTEQFETGKTQYDIDVFVNQKWVRTFYSSEQRQVIELTDLLRGGPNKVTFVAKKKIDRNGRVSSSPRDYYRLVVGQGHQSGRNVVITKSLVDYRRNALEMKDFQDEMSFVAL